MRPGLSSIAGRPTAAVYCPATAKTPIVGMPGRSRQCVDRAEGPDGGVDFIVRGEGEITFRELLRALEAQHGYDHIAGLSYRSAEGFRHNPARRVTLT